MMSDLPNSSMADVPIAFENSSMADLPIAFENSVRALDVEDGLWRTAQIITFCVVDDNICAELQWILTS